jgi:hypothetical protein
MGAQRGDESDPGPNAYWHRVWFMSSGVSDVLAQLYRNEHGLFLSIRFRLYDPAGNDPWSGKDIKKFSVGKLRPGVLLSEMDEHMEGFLNLWASVWGQVVVRECLVIEGDATALHKTLESRPWCSMKSFDSQEEADKFLDARRRRQKN